MNKIVQILCLLLLTTQLCVAQKERKVSFVGGARSIMTNNRLNVTDTLIADTTTALRNTGGYALIDLGVNIKPNKNTEILGMFRIKNNFGGFWGSGVTFDVRQMYIKGVVANALRYQVGDINLKQTPFTLYNHHADAIDSLPEIFNLQRNIVNYEKFYQKNTWRMQGANVDFGLTFKEGIQEINFTGFTTRLNATNFANIPERLMSGAVVQVVQSYKLSASYNINSVYDVRGTVIDSNTFTNTVQSVDLNYVRKIKKNKLSVNAELGTSKYKFSLDTIAPKLNDYFIHANTSFQIKKYFTTATLGYLNVGPEYRSIGAQSKDVNYNALPLYYDRYTNAQNIRPLGLLDVIANENIYNRTVSSRLLAENVWYNNAMPYGMATFNRVGGYGQISYKKNIDANLSYYKLSEIKGQGTLALQNFSIIKTNVKVPVQSFVKKMNKLEVQLGAQLQNTSRTGNVPIENVNLKNTQLTAGINWEILKNCELMGGYVMQNARGTHFIADRNVYAEVTYFTQQQIDIQQNVTALGLKYNFTPKIYLSSIYQRSQFEDGKKQLANFNINQFNIIYNMLF
jgi:hypothetical protein